MRTLCLILLVQPELWGQAPLAIDAVVDSLTGEARLAPGSRALVRLTQNVGSESVTAQVGGKQAAILAVIERGIHVLLPVDLPPGPTTVVVSSRGTATAPFALTLESYAPVLARASIWPGIYCPALAPWGTSLVAYGLGATDPFVPAGVTVPSAPLASTVVKPMLMVAGRQSEVLSSALVPDRINDGSYRIDFRVPPDTPEGSHAVVLMIGGHVSNTETLQVAGIILKTAFTGARSSAAPEAIMSAYACAAPLATREAVGDPRNPSTMLGGTSSRLVDSAGAERPVQMLYASPKQVNLVIPAGTATGPATLTVASGDMAVSRTTIQITAINPELIYVTNYPVGLLVRVRDGIQSVEPVAKLVNGTIEPVPIDFGPSTDELFLVLFGTGLRGRSSLANVKAAIGGMDAPVEYAGPQGEFAGLDQVNIRLPRLLAAREAKIVELSLTVDGKIANSDADTLYLAFK